MVGMTCVCYHRTQEGGTRFVYSTRFTTPLSLSTMHLTQGPGSWLLCSF